MTDKAENTITTELAKENVTEAVIANLKKQYLPLKINGIDDVEGYKKVHEARIVCRDTRTLAERICKKGREAAIKEQKLWIAKEKEVVTQVSEVEQHLKKQEDAIDEQKEAIKIRAERLLKLPGRKEQIIGVEQFFEPNCLEDTYIMTFTDEEWSKVILLAKEKKLGEAILKLAAQQKVIDDAKTLAKMNLVADRENALYKIANASMQIKNGIKTFYKGNVSITEKELGELENEAWNIRFAEITTAVVSVPVEKTGISYKPGVTAKIEPIKEISDEEKLFNYASELEHILVPMMETKEGKDTLLKSQLMLNEVLTLLRK